MRAIIDLVLGHAFILVIVAVLCEMSIGAIDRRGQRGLAKAFAVVAFGLFALVCASSAVGIFMHPYGRALLFNMLSVAMCGYWAVQSYRNHITRLFRS